MIEYNDERHEYKINGVVAPSVTQVIAPLAPDFSFINSDMLKRASNFGKAVHAACEFEDYGTLDESSLDPALIPYLNAWRKCKADLRIVVGHNEEIVFSKAWHVAGRLDKVVEMNNRMAIIDIKTCSTLHRVIGVQLAGYELCARDMGKVSGVREIERYAVRLKENGDYDMKKYEDPTDKDAFIACTQLFHWRKNNAA